MPYSIYRGEKPGKAAWMASTESFWAYVDFDVTQRGGIVGVSRGYWAVCTSGDGRRVPIGQPQFDALSTYTIQGPHGGLIRFRDSTLIASIETEFGNEFANLHLFRFPLPPDAPPDGGEDAPADEAPAAEGAPISWLDLSGWNVVHDEPKIADDRTDLLVQRVSLKGHLRPRYTAARRMVFSGPARMSSLSLLLPFDDASCIKAIQALNGQPMPLLTLSAAKKPAREAADEVSLGGPRLLFESENYAAGRALPGQPHGFAMIAHGAFKAIPWAEVGQWYLRRSQPHEILDRLERTVVAYNQTSTDRPQPFVRTLETADETRRNAIIPQSPDDPVEVFHLRELS